MRAVMKKLFIRYAGCLLMLLPSVAFAQATAWKPERSVELIIGAAPGGANDRIGRSLQRVLQDENSRIRSSS